MAPIRARVSESADERDVVLGEIKVPDRFGANVTFSQLYTFNTRATFRRADNEVYNKDQESRSQRIPYPST